MFNCGVLVFDMRGMSTSEVSSLFISPLLMGLYFGKPFTSLLHFHVVNLLRNYLLRKG